MRFMSKLMNILERIVNMKYNLVDDTVINLVGRGKHWDLDAVELYNGFGLCCKKIEDSTPVGSKVFDKHLERATKFGATDADLKFYTSLMTSNNSRCILPRGHVGPCSANLGKFKNRMLKISDEFGINGGGENSAGTTLQNGCVAPGNKYFYKNRCQRDFPVILSSSVFSSLIKKYGKVKGADCEFSVAAQDAATPLMCLTATIDLYSICFNIDKTVFEKISPEYISIFERVLINMKKTHPIFFNGDRYVDALTGDYFNKTDFFRDRVDFQKPEFGHIIPRSEEAMMTRGGNISFMTRKSNQILGDMTLESPILRETIAKMNSRLNILK